LPVGSNRRRHKGGVSIESGSAPNTIRLAATPR